MRIAFVVNTFPCLSQTFILNQITGLLDLGHDVRIFAFRGEDGLVHDDVSRHGLLERTTYISPPPSKLGRVAGACRWVAAGGIRHPGLIARSLSPARHGRSGPGLSRLFNAKAFLGHELDVLHCHFADTGRVMAALGPDVDHRVFVTSMYGYDVTRTSQTGRSLNAELIATGDAFLSLCGSMDENLVSLGFPRERVQRHPLGIRPGRFRFIERGARRDGPVRVLSVARLVEKKGIEYGLRAVARVVQASSVDLHYRILGDGPLRERLATLARELGLSDHVELAGWRSQAGIVAALEEADVFMLPSVTASDGDQEGTPTVLLEAQAVGLPVLSTRHSGIPEIVRDGEAGFLVPERDEAALADRLAELIRRRSDWPRMGRAGRRFVEQAHDVDRLNRRLIALYERLLAVEPSPRAADHNR